MTTTVSAFVASTQCVLGSMLDTETLGKDGSPLTLDLGWNWTVDAGAMILGFSTLEHEPSVEMGTF